MIYDKKLYDEWQGLYKQAKINMQNTKEKMGKLIEVAAQHPLIEGEFPNEEFEKRLLMAISIYNQDPENTKIYVPGSIHKDNDIVDKISLSEAGKRFLEKRGIPQEDIYWEDMNQKYKGDAGVYNSTDECFVASNIFKEGYFGELHCVCSSGQMMRKVLSYIRFGLVPFMHTVSCNEMYHDYVDEIFKFIPILIEDKYALQKNSEEADRLRELRKPKQ